MDLFIADTHFGHEDRVKWDGRPFADADEMFRVMRERWNAKVTDDDDVWIIGDFAYYGEEDIAKYSERLNGRKHLIYGNHDRRIEQNPRLQQLFVECTHLKYIRSGGRDIFLSHYPMTEWHGRPRGYILIYGHIHGSLDDGYEFMAKNRTEEAFNAGCMINGYVPVTFEELRANNLRYHKENFSDKGESL